MGKHSERIINYLNTEKKCFCDNCLSKLLRIKSRQTVNSICNKLYKQEIIRRYKGECSYCNKKIN